MQQLLSDVLATSKPHDDSFIIDHVLRTIPLMSEETQAIGLPAANNLALYDLIGFAGLLVEEVDGLPFVERK
jgi:hypothetical protein